MVTRFASRLRIILHDVSGSTPRYMSSFVVAVAELPDDFVGWLRLAALGHVGSGKKGFPAPAIAAKKARTAEVKGEVKKSLPRKRKGGAERGEKT
jgi:hypothetical protein